MSRRQVLRKGTMLGLSIPMIGGLLAACGGGDDDGGDEAPTPGSGGSDSSPTTAAVSGTAAGGSPASGSGTAINGGTLTIIQTGSIPDFDPHSAYDSDASALFFGTYEMLVRLRGSDTFEYEPMLAESWEANADQTEWSFSIPAGVTFHDGTPCDAAAVVASFQRFHNLGLGPVGVLTRFVETPEDITAPDSTTITFKLSYGTDIFLAAMASQYGPLVISPAAIEANATGEDEFAHEWLRENMVGTGPYKLAENVLGDHITLERFEEYHGGWDGNHFDTIVFRNVEESQTRRQLVESGDADALTQSLTADDVTAMQEEGTTNVLVYDSTNADWIGFNPVRLADPAVRQAFCWAFPYEDVRTGVYEQLIEASSGPCTPTTLGYPKDGFIYTTDLDKAQQLLDDAGFDSDQTLEFWITSGDQDQQAIAQLYQANLQELGVTVEIVSKEEGALTDFFYGEAPAEERPHFMTNGWWPDYNDAWNEIHPNFHSQSGQTAAGGNQHVYSNADVDRLLDESSMMSAGPEYDETIAEINRILVEEDPAAAFMGSVKWYTVLHPTIKGFVSNPIYINTYNVYDMYREQTE
ncbi:MAG: ABC transporter substrate-binding protein [Chloroflexota bacterium]|nr:ABC transporter substrate-binding protein [Chloroflexota bacterium]